MVRSDSATEPYSGHIFTALSLCGISILTSSARTSSFSSSPEPTISKG